ncbi:MAG: hypothetical protein IPM30_14930 [Burkholderiales bacterium]|nr:hypothetical protein [Burkholderiales bacterium]
MQQDAFQELIGRLGAADRELYEERAAIREFDGLQPREHAEALALLDVLRLRPAALLGVEVLEAELDGDSRCALVTDRRAVRLRLLCEADRGADLAAIVAGRFGGAALLSPVPD